MAAAAKELEQMGRDQNLVDAEPKLEQFSAGFSQTSQALGEWRNG